MTISYLIIFGASSLLLAAAGHALVRSLSRIADFLGWREFTVSFFIMSAATALPELLVGVSAALRGVPELSLGNIIGQNIIHFTIAVSLCFLAAGSFAARSKTNQVSARFTALAAVLPALLIIDGTLSRNDGLVLIAAFGLYSAWIFNRRERFEKTFIHNHHNSASRGTMFSKLGGFGRDVFRFFLGAGAIIIAAQGMVLSAVYFAGRFSVPLGIIGTLFVGLGTSLPEGYFSIASGRDKRKDLMLGNLLGATAVSATLVLGAVAIRRPVIITDPSPYFIGRLFLFIAAAVFTAFLATNRRIGKWEALVLALIYALFVFAEIAAGK